MTTPYEKNLRLRWYRLVEVEHRPVHEVCKLFGVPKKTYYKWYARDHGYGTNEHRSKKPDSKTKLTYEIKKFIEAMKKKGQLWPT